MVQYLTQILENLASSKNCSLDELTSDLHVYPDFHGNRSPLADPGMRGMISGICICILILCGHIPLAAIIEEDAAGLLNPEILSIKTLSVPSLLWVEARSSA